MPESTETPDLDTRLRGALIPVLDLEAEEMLDDVIVIYTVVYPDGDGLRYVSSKGITPWTARGMVSCFKEMLPEQNDYEDEDEDD